MPLPLLNAALQPNHILSCSPYLVRYEGIEGVSLHASLEQLIAGLSTRLPSHQCLRLSQEVGQQNLERECYHYYSVKGT